MRRILRVRDAGVSQKKGGISLMDDRAVARDVHALLMIDWLSTRDGRSFRAYESKRVKERKGRQTHLSNGGAAREFP